MNVTFAQVSGWVVRYLLTIRISDILDIAIMAFVLYKIFTLVQSTKAASLVKGLLIFLAALVLSSALHLNGINYIMTRMVNLGLLALIILFQPEIRRVLEQVGSRRLVAFFIHEESASTMEQAIGQTVLACTEMSQSRTGGVNGPVCRLTGTPGHKALVHLVSDGIQTGNGQADGRVPASPGGYAGKAQQQAQPGVFQKVCGFAHQKVCEPTIAQQAGEPGQYGAALAAGLVRCAGGQVEDYTHTHHAEHPKDHSVPLIMLCSLQQRRPSRCPGETERR